MYLFLTSRCQVSRQANILLTRAKKRKAKKKSLLALHRFFLRGSQRTALYNHSRLRAGKDGLVRVQPRQGQCIAKMGQANP